jgi:ubiquinone/menaquinone biosynthesis C-methylase UbiE
MSEVKVRQQYDQIAINYDQRWKRYILDTLSFLKTWAQIAPMDTVLDVACGTGEFERLILAENPTQQMVGIDISEKIDLIGNKVLGVGNSCLARRSRAKQLFPIKFRVLRIAISNEL